jgi:hypothetical protein
MNLLSSGFYLHADGTFWRMVPADQTAEMLDALNNMAQCEGHVELGYDAMLKAAPWPPHEKAPPKRG